jgi:hypothetical protein
MSEDERRAAPFDEALVAFGELVAGFGPDEEALGGGLWVERVSLDLPFELEVAAAADGGVILGGAPPTQHLETSIMPVLHRLRLRITRDRGHAG